jgi:hypothetical protein
MLLPRRDLLPLALLPGSDNGPLFFFGKLETRFSLLSSSKLKWFESLPPIFCLKFGVLPDF